MHDGRFESLEEVLSHYTNGVKQSGTLDPTLASGINLSATEKTQIVAFLKTLTDIEFTKDERFKE
jgi:cytochrome c peroxidase